MQSFNKSHLVILCLLFLAASCQYRTFNEREALGYIATQVAFGPRIPGSESSKNFLLYLEKELSNLGWETRQQNFIYDEIQITNIIAKNSPDPPDIILGTHFDTRLNSDRDPVEDFRSTPVPGANDGASGTAVLLELANQLIDNKQDIWLVFFDAEDQGDLNNWNWSIGAQYFVDHLSDYPKEAIIIDMIGDNDLNIYYEANSSKELSTTLWNIAENLGYGDSFIKETKYSIIDDHLPFIEKGIPTVLIIDLDYEKWHTTEDNLKYVSADSLNKVGTVLSVYLNK